MALPATRAARNAVLDAVRSILHGLEVEDADGETYTISCQGRPPGPGTTVTLPAVGLVMPTYDADLHEPQPVPGGRSPAEGAGVYVERCGELRGIVEIHPIASDEDEEDEILGAVEQVFLAPAGSDTASRTVVNADYHGAIVSLSYLGGGTLRDPQQTGVWFSLARIAFACPILRSATAADLQPRIGLTVDGEGEYVLDFVEGTTADPE